MEAQKAAAAESKVSGGKNTSSMLISEVLVEQYKEGLIAKCVGKDWYNLGAPRQMKANKHFSKVTGRWKHCLELMSLVAKEKEHLRTAIEQPDLDDIALRRHAKAIEAECLVKMRNLLGNQNSQGQARSLGMGETYKKYKKGAAAS